MSRFKAKRIAISSLVFLALLLSACSPQGNTDSSKTESGKTESAQSQQSDKNRGYYAEGTQGAVVSDTTQATEAGISVLKEGGSAADAAVAVAASLGVTDPFVAGLGGGGYLVYYDAASKSVGTIDGRETAKAADNEEMFRGEDGKAMSSDDANFGSLAVGVPGQLALWERALQRWGKLDLAKDLQPAIRTASEGFAVTKALENQIADNQKTFSKFSPTADTYLPGGTPLAEGTTLKNPELAKTYQLIADQGTAAFYQGEIAQSIIKAVNTPPTSSGTTVKTGTMAPEDLSSYQALDAEPIKNTFRGLDVYGMGSSSSGGVTVGEILGILNQSPADSDSKTQSTLRLLEASKLAFADRNAYVGDRASMSVPDNVLLSDNFLKSRACRIDTSKALPVPQLAGDLGATGCQTQNSVTPTSETKEGTQTNHFVVSDQWGNIASYTNTINYYGGSGILVPERGFMLNNELTDFDFVAKNPGKVEPNLPAPGKRPRSSMSPSLVLRDGQPFLALGSPGGSTIITTVAQVLQNRVDRGMNLEDAVQAPRASQRNMEKTLAEPGFAESPEAQEIEKLGYTFQIAPTSDQNPSSKTKPTIGVVAALEFGDGGKITAVGEKERRSGTSAQTVKP